MATLTSRLKLVKAALLDNADITVNVNPSFDIVDTEIGLPKIASGGGLPGSPYDGQIRRDLNDGYLKVWDATAGAWVPLLAGPSNNLQGAGGSWKQNNAPTISGLTAIGTGTTKNLLSYIRLAGNIIFYKYDLLLGVGGSGAGSFLLTLPVEFPVDISANISAYSQNDCIGHGSLGLTVASASRITFSALLNSTVAPGQIFLVSGASPGATLGLATPFALGNGSVLTIEGWYRTSAA